MTQGQGNRMLGCKLQVTVQDTACQPWNDVHLFVENTLLFSAEKQNEYNYYGLHVTFVCVPSTYDILITLSCCVRGVLLLLLLLSVLFKAVLSRSLEVKNLRQKKTAKDRDATAKETFNEKLQKHRNSKETFYGFPAFPLPSSFAFT